MSERYSAWKNTSKRHFKSVYNVKKNKTHILCLHQTFPEMGSNKKDIISNVN